MRGDDPRTSQVRARIGIAPILPICASRGAFRVRARFRIARTRADSARFSAMSETAETEMWRKQDLNIQPVSRLPDESRLFRLASVILNLTSVRESWAGPAEPAIPFRPVPPHPT